MGATTGRRTTKDEAARAPLTGAGALASTVSGAVLLVLTSAPAAHAIPVPGVLARATVQPSFSCGIPGCGPVDNIVQASSGPLHADGFAIGDFGGVGQATADANFGEMHLYAHFANAGSAIGWGQNRDLLTFTDPHVANGTLIDVTFAILVEGGIDGVNGALGAWQLQADLGGGAYDINAFAHNGDVGGYQGSPFGLYQATVQVQSGFVAPLVIELQTSAGSITGGEAVGDLVDSLYWAGITNVSAGGQSVSDFTLTSASGTNWANSFIPPAGGVPEPASWALMLVGFGGMGALMRRRAALARG